MQTASFLNSGAPRFLAGSPCASFLSTSPGGWSLPAITSPSSLQSPLSFASEIYIPSKSLPLAEARFHSFACFQINGRLSTGFLYSGIAFQKLKQLSTLSLSNQLQTNTSYSLPWHLLVTLPSGGAFQWPFTAIRSKDRRHKETARAPCSRNSNTRTYYPHLVEFSSIS